MNQLITFDGFLVTFFFVVCIACSVQIVMKRELATTLIFLGLIVVLLVTVGRIVCFRFVMAGYQVSEFYLWIPLFIGFVLIMIGLMFKLIQITKSNIKEIFEAIRRLYN